MSTIAKTTEIGKNFEEIKTNSAAHRAELLAARIEQGAAGLAAFAETLSEQEWSQPVPERGKAERSVGVIIDHVASVYPIEIQLARAIAGGKPVTDVTWEAVAHLNANHACEHAVITKAATIDLLVVTAEKLPMPSVGSRTGS